MNGKKKIVIHVNTGGKVPTHTIGFRVTDNEKKMLDKLVEHFHYEHRGVLLNHLIKQIHEQEFGESINHYEK